MSVLNSLNGAQVQSYVDEGYCAHVVEENLSERVGAFFKSTTGNEDIINAGDLDIDKGNESDSVSITIDEEYAYMLESDSDSDDSEPNTNEQEPRTLNNATV